MFTFSYTLRNSFALASLLGSAQWRSVMHFGRRQVIAGALSLGLFAPKARAAGECPPNDPSFHPFGVPSVCNAFVNPKDLEISAQANSEWCWAATIHNIFSYHGHQVTQDDIVDAGIGAVANQPGDIGVMSRVLNRQWTDADNNTFTSQGELLYSADLRMGDANNIRLINELSGDDPLLVCNQSHAMMLISVNYVPPVPLPRNVVQAIVIDPWPGFGLRALTPQELIPMSSGGALRLIIKVSIS